MTHLVLGQLSLQPYLNHMPAGSRLLIVLMTITICGAAAG